MTDQTAVLSGTGDLETLRYSGADETVIVVAQDAGDGRVLMVAHADREALRKTLETGEMWYRSRTRGLWHKGATSGNVQRLVQLRRDCDGDTVLAIVRPAGPACHTGEPTCFGDYQADALSRLDATIEDRRRAPAAQSYTARLLADANLRHKKLGEETVELVMASAANDPSRAVSEAADLVYHVAVALHGAGASLRDVRAELTRRERPAQ
jgi:phosphoribosyl-ATP pyrophosphohydrolase/phosphoribosyl-AMP cyclohydrolase